LWGGIEPIVEITRPLIREAILPRRHTGWTDRMIPRERIVIVHDKTCLFLDPAGYSRMGREDIMQGRGAAFGHPWHDEIGMEA